MSPSLHPEINDSIELHFEEKTGIVRVTPGDDTLLLMSVEEAIHACRAFKRQLEFKGQFDQLLKCVWQWLTARREKVSNAFLTTRDEGLLLLIVTETSERDETLESEITELDLQIANDADYRLIDLSVLAIPKCPKESIQSFLSRKMSLRFVLHGDEK